MSQFDHEKLKVYRLALQFVGWLDELLVELRQHKQPKLREAINQIDRAATSIVLNIAEGNGRRGTRQRAKFFDDARGSAAESAGCLDVIVTKKGTTPERIVAGKQSLHRIVSMLSKLIDRFDQ